MKLHLLHAKASMHGVFCLGKEPLSDITPEESDQLFELIQSLIEYPLHKKTLLEFSVSEKISGLCTQSWKKMLHQEMGRFLPKGENAPSWRLWMTEAQMALHQHPVNQIRQEKNKATVDWVWLENPDPRFWKRCFSI